MRTLNDFFDKIYCINLDDRKDRMVAAAKQFHKHNLWVERVPGIKGSDMNLDFPPQIKEGIVKDIFAIYTNPPIKQIRTSDKLNAIQKKHLIIKDLAIKLGYSTNQLKEYIKGYNFRYYVQKTMLNDIDKINFDDDENYLNEKLKINEEMEKTLQEIGIF